VAERSARRYDDDLPDDQRSPFQRDRDRILYTTAFRRLAGITQVVSPNERPPVHNRLTHTLEVAQVARRLAEKICAEIVSARTRGACPIDPDVVEAAALAHDLGHPPFGHIAEAELDRLATSSDDHDGYNGNAQSFRILAKLAVRTTGADGLNLTRATLDAVLKYPWFRPTAGSNRFKWGAYHSEEELARWVRPDDSWDGSAQPCPEASIMDWADDIAYAVHDVEDFYRAGLIPLDRLATDEAERRRLLDARTGALSLGKSETNITQVLDEFTEVIPLLEPYAGTREQRALLRGWTSTLIGRYIGAMTWSVVDNGHLHLAIAPRAELEVAMLKQLTWHYVIERESLATQQYGQRKMIRTLFETLRDDAHATSGGKNKRYTLFPPYYRELLEQAADDAERTRLVIDLIASMTEHQVVDTYQRLTGIAQGSAFDLL
jgi:dGTPase